MLLFNGDSESSKSAKKLNSGGCSSNDPDGDTRIKRVLKINLSIEKPL
jgi:hypothetical protein